MNTHTHQLGSVRRFASRTAIWLALALAAIALGGCYSPLQSSIPEDQLIAAGEYDLIAAIDVPHVRGEAGCGNQALATAIAHVDRAVEPAALAEELPWHDQGATPPDLLIVARQLGYDAQVQRGSWETLEENVRAGTPSLIMIDASFQLRSLFSRAKMPQVMHWMIVSGLSRDGTHVLLAAPNHRHHRVHRDEFLPRWAKADYCVILVTPTRQAGAASDPR